MVIYIVRHPETEYNRRGLIQGHGDSRLTRRGMDAARKLGKRLSGRGVTRIYTSDLGRCTETTELINRYLGLKVTRARALREQNLGEYSGRPEALLGRIHIRSPDAVMPGGESFNQMRRRVLRYVGRLGGRNVLVVTHEGCVRAILSHAYGIPPSSAKCSTRAADILAMGGKSGRIRRLRYPR